MLQDDYLMRRIRIATAAFARLLGFKRSGNYQDALDTIDQALEVIFGLNPTLINSMDDDSLLALLSTQAGLDGDKTLILAGLFKERGDIFGLINRPGDSQVFHMRALILYIELFLNPSQIPEEVLTAKIDDILAIFYASELPADATYPLFFYYEQTKQYEQASQMLTALLESDGNNPDLLSQVKAFYRRLVEMGDQELLNGGLTRATVQARLDQLAN